MRALAHDNIQSGSPVTTQYFDQGAVINGTSYYYVWDRLGSVTVLLTSSVFHSRAFRFQGTTEFECTFIAPACLRNSLMRFLTE